MMIFWLIIGILTALSLLALLHPLTKSAETAPADTAESDIAVYKDQLKEIDRDLKAGNLAEAQAETARIEIQRRILNTSQEQSASTKSNPLSPLAIKTVLSLLILTFPAAGILLYLQLGQPGAPGMPLAERNITAERMALAREDIAKRDSEILSIAQKLEAKLIGEPTNLEGWMLLGSTYTQLNKFALAEKAFRKAMENTPPNAMVYGAIGEMMVAQAEGQVSPEALSLFGKSLELNPQDARGLFYSGLALSQSGDNEGALKLWLTLRQHTLADDPWLELLDTQIAQIAAKLGIDTSKLQASYPAKISPAATTQAGPTSEDIAAAAELSSEERNAMINGMVDRLASKLKETPDDFKGWIQLIRSYHTLGRIEEAQSSLSKAEAAAQKQQNSDLAMTQINSLKQELGL